MTDAGTRLIQAAQEADAFMSGGYAWEDGATLTSNPHAIGSGAHEMWREGWFFRGLGAGAMAKFKVKALAVVEFEVDFPASVTALQARSRLVDDAEWSHRKTSGFVDELIKVESIELVSEVSSMPASVKRK